VRPYANLETPFLFIGMLMKAGVLCRDAVLLLCLSDISCSKICGRTSCRQRKKAERKGKRREEIKKYG
jgi:hypothetical protein